ncbi:MAG: hypothetical protein RQM92_09820 [Candidatus Syntrophopropionicum ammoniitolerans]
MAKTDNRIAKLEAENRQLNSLLANAFLAMEAQERVIKGFAEAAKDVAGVFEKLARLGMRTDSCGMCCKQCVTNKMGHHCRIGSGNTTKP